MAAVNARGESARDRAVRRVLDGARSTWQPARGSPSSERRTSVGAAGPAALAVEARPALDDWKPEAPHHSLALGLRLARELAGRTGRLMVMSDVAAGLARRGRDRGRLWVSLGEPLANVGITAAERTLTPGEGRGAVSLTLGNYSDSPARRRVERVGRRQGRPDQGARGAARQSPRSRFRCPPVCRRCASRCPTMRWLATTR